jgi:hypothetical protein
VHVGQSAGVIKAGHEPEKSAVAEGSISTGHCTDFGGISISHRILGHVGGLVKEETEINLDKNNFDSDGGSCDRQVTNVTTGPIRTVTTYSAHQLSCLATGYSRAVRMSRRGSGHFPDEDDRDGSRNVCFLAIKLPVAAASHRAYY